MRRRHGRKVSLGERQEVREYLREDLEVTRERLDLFWAEPERVRLLVMAELRRRVEDQEHVLVPALEAAGLAIFAIFISITPDSMRSAVIGHLTMAGWSRWVTVTGGYLIYAVIVLIVLLPSIRAGLLRNRDRGRAVVWLAAYKQDADERLQRIPSHTLAHRGAKVRPTVGAVRVRAARLALQAGRSR